MKTNQPRKTYTPNRIDFLLHTPIAHRGLHNHRNAPENSIQAFKNAIDGRFPIELDVHIIKSGEVVVFHDDNLKRMCGIDKPIEKCTLDELRELRLQHTSERIPLLSEALTVINGHVPLLIELKSEHTSGKLEQAVMLILKKYHGKYALQSFNPLTLNWLRKNAPKVPRGQLACGFTKMHLMPPVIAKFALKRMLFNRLTQPDFISYEAKILPQKCVTKCHEQGLPILGWTITRVSESQLALKYCDNIICEDIL